MIIKGRREEAVMTSYPAVAFGHAPAAQLVHQSREDAAAVAFVPQSIQHDQTNGVQLGNTWVLEQPPHALKQQETHHSFSFNHEFGEINQDVSGVFTCWALEWSF